MPLKIADMMILVGATAFGLGVILPASSTISGRMIAADSAQETIRVAVMASWPCVVAWTLGALLLRLRRDSYLPNLCRQPGDAACGVAAVVLTLAIIPFLVFAISRGLRRLPVRESPGEVMFSWWADSSAPTYAGLAVAATWLNLAAKDAWNPPKDWIARLGQALGVLWVGRLVVLVACKGLELVETIRSPIPSY